MDSYRLMVDGVRSCALYFLSPSGMIQAWNPGAEVLHGIAAGEAIGQHFSNLFIDDDRSKGVADAELESAIKSGGLEAARYQIGKDGRHFWAQSSYSAVQDGGGAIAGVAVLTRDATACKRVEDQLERTHDELHRFAFVVSHDLQEPTRTIRSYSELLERRYREKLDGEASDFLNFMGEAATRMTQLLKDLLAYSQAGRADRTKPEPTSALTILQWALMNVNPLVKETNATITYDPLPEVLVDQTQFASLLQHLLTNALKFRSSEAPQIHVSAAVEPEGFWRFAVRDNGIGIDPQFHERVFGVFKRLHGKDVAGTGIGLAICRKIVEAHGGRIWLESTAGNGTTVFFTLPPSD